MSIPARARACLVAMMAALTVVSVPLAPAPAAEAQAETRILIVGDSVSQGADGDYTWRFFAHRGLVETGATVDLVGHRVGTYLNDHRPWGGSYANPHFDTDHSARWGLSLWEMLYSPDAAAPTIDSLVDAHQPDVVVEMLGINDFLWLHTRPSQMLRQVREFVARARAAKADIDIVLGSLPHASLARVRVYNAALPALAAELSTPDSRVVSSPVPSHGLAEDGVHPTTTGEAKIAHAVSVALESLGVGRSITITAPPARPRRIQAVRGSGQSVRVSWRAPARAERYRVACGHRVRRTRHTGVTVRLVPRRVGSCRVRAINETGGSAWKRSRIRSR